MKSLIKKVVHFFKCKCPRCGEDMRSVFFDMEIDHMVYECKHCGERWF